MTITELTAAPAGVARLFAARGSDYAQHLACFGPLPHVPSLVTMLEESGLVGRGGAGFPTWRKLAAITSLRPIVVANGAEGEPLSEKDATLLRSAPHLVIDGLLLAATAVGASETYLYAASAELAIVRRALAARTDASHIVLRDAVDTFLSGEASAVVNAIERGVAVPRDHVERLTDRTSRPTLVQNVETLAHAALIARFGAAWFRSLGTETEPGTRLLSISADGQKPVVIEAAGGIRISDALHAVGLDPADQRAVLVGGYHGAWVPSEAFGLPLSRTALARYGATPGAGIIVGLSIGRCGIMAASEIATYLAGQSARQCGPCANGLPAMAATLLSLAQRHGDATTVARVRELAAIVTGRGSCNHPDGTARLVLSTLTVFESDVERHLVGECEAQS
jgi:NADH:ubiquinone oxidoreductase subunit F (NADH-binding)